ncbi:MAG: 50S ribosomal protein L25/general stress protein Ctc [Cellvibrionales bacterium]|nr:50S ribosomal protein L25/general stress protein Ctc [Cellvibrionales bacterium]
MSEQIKLQATSRSDLGKGSSRRLRRTGFIPAVVYGGKEAQSVTIEHKELWKAQEHESFFSSVITLEVDGTEEPVIIKALQRHPAKDIVLHADFQRADDSIEVEMNIPLHYINTATCKGVKLQGGSLQLDAKLVKVKCAPSKIPEYLEIDMQDAVVGQIIHISDINFPEGVRSSDLALGAKHDLALAQVKAPRGGKKAEEAAEG